MAGPGRLCILALLLVAIAAQHCAGSTEADARPDWADAFILTEQSYPRILKLVATPNKEVIYTTYFLGNDDIRYMLRNFVYWIQQAGQLQHTMLITQDEGSWRALLDEGMPAFLDTLTPGKDAFADPNARYAQRPFDFSKTYWALKFAQAGYASLSLDSDVIMLQNPFPALGALYDLQGLSDYRADPPELPKLGEILTRRCDLYRIKKAGEREGGDVLHPSWELEGAAKEGSMRALTPCLSIGLLHMRPTPAIMAFLEAVIEWMMKTHLHQWDQAAWNEVLMGFLAGMGEQPPLKFRLLPVKSFANIEVWEARKKQRLAVDPAILHAGYIKGSAKAERMKELGFWKPDDIDRDASSVNLQRFNGSSSSSSSSSLVAAKLAASPASGWSAKALLGLAALIGGLLVCTRKKRRRTPGKHRLVQL